MDAGKHGSEKSFRQGRKIWSLEQHKKNNRNEENESESQTREPHRCLHWGPGRVVIIFIKALEWM